MGGGAASGSKDRLFQSDFDCSFSLPLALQAVVAMEVLRLPMSELSWGQLTRLLCAIAEELQRRSTRWAASARPESFMHHADEDVPLLKPSICPYHCGIAPCHEQCTRDKDDHRHHRCRAHRRL